MFKAKPRTFKAYPYTFRAKAKNKPSGNAIKVFALIASQSGQSYSVTKKMLD